jgi:hypothetical protein
MGQLVTNWWAFQLLPARLQAWLLGTITMLQMPAVKGNNTIKTYVSEALHFRRGVRKYSIISFPNVGMTDEPPENMRVRDSEWSIPFPALEGTGGQKRDYGVIQRAWSVPLKF